MQQEIAEPRRDADLVVFAAVTARRSRARAAHRARGPLRDRAEDVLGVDMQVYEQRMRTLRELMAQSAARADVDFVVQGDQRLHLRRARPRGPRAVASSLARLGVGVGDRVALVLGEQSRVGRDVLGVRGARRGRRAAERVVEGRGARVRAQRLRGEGADLRRAPARR